MRIEFEPSLEAFADYYVGRSREVRRGIFWYRFAAAILLAWGLAYFWIGKPYGGIVMSAIPVALLVFSGRVLRRSARRLIVRRAASRKRPAWKLSEPSTVEVRPGELLVKDPDSESRIAARALEAVYATPTHVFIYVTPHTAIPIDRSRVLSGDLEVFTSRLRAEIESSA